MPFGEEIAAAAIPSIIDGIASWLMDDSEDEEKRRELEAQLDRERRRMPPWAYERVKGLLTGSVMPSGMGGGAGAGAPMGTFQRVSGQGAGAGAGTAPGGGMSPRLAPPSTSPIRTSQRNPQLQSFLGR